MFNFRSNRKTLSKSERYYEPVEEPFSSKIFKFPIFVTVGLILVVLIIGMIFYFNYSNNVFKKFIDASSNNFDSGGFEYHVSAGVNKDTFMDYTGELSFDLSKQSMTSIYHAIYEEYEYDAAVYSKGDYAYRGNYYGGKWSVDDYADRSLDFFDFYRDYRKGVFDAGAALRFTKNTDKFNAQQLQEAVDNITKELMKPSGAKNILHAQTHETANGTIITFTPDMDKVYDIIVDNIGSAYTSANAYAQFKETVNNSKANLDSVIATVSYTIDQKGYLTDISIDYTLKDEHYFFKAEMSNFLERELQLPQGFVSVIGLEAE
ncbi:MAG: hypothetical protein E7513_02675 [Ruminococcaceae bacterium]|nr:hypothetical protein [Oscillospiraceae bacterium]